MKKKVVSLVSGGIDSPVASHLMMKKGVDVVVLHMWINQAGSEIALNLVQRLADIHKRPVKAYVVKHATIMEAMKKACADRLSCVLCKRTMYRVAAAIARKEKAAAVVTGENLGQVASQTLDNMYVVSRSIDTPVLRPLIGMDKEQIMNIAKDVGTFDAASKGTCTCPFLPRRPATHSVLEKVEAEEEKAGIEELAKKAVEDAKVIIVKPRRKVIR